MRLVSVEAFSIGDGVCSNFLLHLVFPEALHMYVGGLVFFFFFFGFFDVVQGRWWCSSVMICLCWSVERKRRISNHVGGGVCHLRRTMIWNIAVELYHRVSYSACFPG